MTFDYMLEAASLAKFLAGDQFDTLWQSREAVFDLLAHPLPDVRAAAVICGYTKWGCRDDAGYRELCCQLAETDTDKPREIAITYLTEMFRGTRSVRVKRILANIVCDNSADAYMRNLAYRALREVEYGYDPESVVGAMRDVAMLANGKYVHLDQIEWTFVNEATRCDMGHNADVPVVDDEVV